MASRSTRAKRRSQSEDCEERPQGKELIKRLRLASDECDITRNLRHNWILSHTPNSANPFDGRTSLRVESEPIWVLHDGVPGLLRYVFEPSAAIFPHRGELVAFQHVDKRVAEAEVISGFSNPVLNLFILCPKDTIGQSIVCTEAHPGTIDPSHPPSNWQKRCVHQGFVVQQSVRDPLSNVEYRPIQHRRLDHLDHYEIVAGSLDLELFTCTLEKKIFYRRPSCDASTLRRFMETGNEDVLFEGGAEANSDTVYSVSTSATVGFKPEVRHVRFEHSEDANSSTTQFVDVFYPFKPSSIDAQHRQTLMGWYKAPECLEGGMACPRKITRSLTFIRYEYDDKNHRDRKIWAWCLNNPHPVTGYLKDAIERFNGEQRVPVPDLSCRKDDWKDYEVVRRNVFGTPVEFARRGGEDGERKSIHYCSWFKRHSSSK